MAASVFFNWPTAKRVGIRGQMVRRNGWTTKWWKFQGGIWWLVTDAETRVIRNTDYTREDLRALDWTNMPADCVTAALADAGKTCPETVDPTDPVYIVDPPYTPPTGDPGDPTDPPTTPTPVVDPPADFPTDPGDPPAARPPGDGGGGGGGGGGGKPRPPRPPRPPKPGPTVTLSLMDSRNACYDCSGFGGMQTTTISGTATVAGGSESVYAVTVTRGGKIVSHGTVGPGGSHGFAENVTAAPCHTFRYKARAWAPGMADAVAQESIRMQGCCSGELSIHAYYLSEWGYHTCDNAVFDVDLNGIALGQINLNNGSDGGDRSSNLSASEAQVTAAKAVNPVLTLSFVCALGYCHSGVAYVEVYGANGLIWEGNQDSTTLELPSCPAV